MATTYELIVKATDRSSGPLSRINKNLKDTERASKRLSASMKAAGAALAGIFTGSVIQKIVSTTAKFEDFQDTLDTVTGSAKEGQKAFKGIQSFATRTQFSVEELTRTYIKLAGAGIKPTEELLTTFTDTAAVATDQIGVLDSMADLFSRTVSGGLGLEELNRLADRGVPVFRILEEQLGLTRLEVSKFGKTTEGAEKIRAALVTGLNASFGGATQGKLDNLSTAMSNFGIAVTNAADQIGSQFRPQLTAAINDASKFIAENEKLLKVIGTDLGTAVTASANSIKFLADNFTIIRNAALTLIGLRIASFFGNLASRMSSAIAGAKTFGGIFGGMAKAVGRAIARIPLLGSSLTMIGGVAARVAPLLTNPFTAIPTIIAGAVAGALYFFRDTMFNLGGTSVSVGETVKAVFTILGETFNKVANYFKTAFGQAVDSVVRFFGDIPEQGAYYLQIMADKASVAANFILNAFVAAIDTIAGIFKNLPGFFKGSMNAIVELGAEAITTLINGFSALGPALKAAVAGDFQGAMNMVSEGFAADFSGAIARGFADAPSLIPDINYKEIFQTDRLSEVAQIYEETTGPLRVTIKKFAVSAFESANEGLEPLRNKILETVQANRELTKEQQLALFKQMEYAHGAKNVAVSIDDVSSSFGTNGEAASKATQEISALDAAYKALFADIDEANKETDLQQQLIARLNKELAAGVISLDKYAEGMKKINEQMGITEPTTFSGKLMQAEQKIFDARTEDAERKKIMEALKASGRFKDEEIIAAGFMDRPKPEKEADKPALQQLTERIKEQKAAYDSLNISTEEQKRIAKELGISYSQFSEQLKQSMSGMEMFKTEAQIFAEEMEEGFRRAGESLSKNLARDLIKGRSVLDSFKNFFDSILEQMLQAVIQKKIMQPFMDSLMGGMGGGMGGGLFGGLGSSIFGFLGAPGFAVGGAATQGQPYVVGEKGPELFMPGTTGRVIPRDDMAAGGGATPVTFQIQALDSKAGTEFILENKNKIINMINSAQRQRGKMGIMD